MSRMKYPRDEKGRVILGTQHGITITRPWSNEMYEHNNKVAEKMKSRICSAIDEAIDKHDFDKLKLIGKTLHGYRYGSGHTFDSVYQDVLRGIKHVENFWLHSWAWEELVENVIVEDFEPKMIGYDKL